MNLKNESPTPAQEKDTVYVSFATDTRYLAPSLVAVKSIVSHACDAFRYSVIILSEHPLNAVIQRLFRSIIRDSDNVSISFYPVGQRLGSIRLSRNGPTKGITRATYLRFLLPDLLKDIDKVLYMDVDTIALDDISRIFFLDVNGYLIGGVRDISGYLDSESRCRELGIDSLDQYVNAGVLLLNLNEMRLGNYGEKMLCLAQERSFPYNDQDIINALCYGRIKLIPFNCNAIVEHLRAPEEISSTLGMSYPEETDNPVILHYAGRSKPWYHPTHRLSSHWWKVADSFKGITALIFKFYMNRLVK